MNAQSSASARDFDYLKNHASNYWKSNHFFSPQAVVLGLDVGMEGIGICVRRGAEILFCRTLLMSELPSAAPLANRRAFRAARHARKNYRVRMARLKDLFANHGLPWVSDEIMQRSDPFELRWRAIKPGGKALASREALSICVRSIVARRGYDYYAMSQSGNSSWPWGDGLVVDEIIKWLRTSYVDQQLRSTLESLRDREELVTASGAPPSEKKLEAFTQALENAVEHSSALELAPMLERYARNERARGDDRRKMRGTNYPRALLEKHLVEIIDRHAHLLDDVAGFKNSLLRRCETRQDKALSIFHYNRKTPYEAEKLWEKKTAKCQFASRLNLPVTNCAPNGDTDIRRYKLLSFLSVRRFDLSRLDAKKKPVPETTERRLLPASAICSLLEATLPETPQPPLRTLTELTKLLTSALASEDLALDKSAENSKNWNKSQLEALKDLCCPLAASLKARSSLCAASAREIVAIMTNNGTDFDPANMESRYSDEGLYAVRSATDLHFGCYPQVAKLLGELNANPDGSCSQASTGYLHKLFGTILAPQLGGKSLPDYVVVESIRSGARNEDEKREMLKKQQDNKAAAAKRLAAYNLEETRISAAGRRKLRLWEEQGGTPDSPARCPFTGQLLPAKGPLAEGLELAHLFPDSRGGFYVNENLVLTTREVNDRMQDRTPLEAAAAGIFGVTTSEMLANSKNFRWSDEKRALFAFTGSSGQAFPDFGNLTRMGQLSSQLRKRVIHWLGLWGSASGPNEDFSAEIRERVGNPSGTHTAILWKEFMGDTPKDRSSHLHHRADAALLTFIPPTGLNDVRYSGCFFTRLIPSSQPGSSGYRRHTCIMADPGFHLPDSKSLQALLDISHTECPVIRLSSRSKNQSLGDSTFWSVRQSDRSVWQRKSLEGWLQKSKKLSSETVLENLKGPFADDHDLTFWDAHLPSKKAIDEWLRKNTPTEAKKEDSTYTPLRNAKGQIFLYYYEKGSKNTLASGELGWTGIRTESGSYDQMAILNGVNDRLELWIGYDPKKGEWIYQRQICPTAQCLYGLRRLGLTLEQAMPGRKPLLPGSRKVGQFRKNDAFYLDAKESEHSWFFVSSIRTNGQLVFLSLTNKDKPKTYRQNLADLAQLLGLPAAGEYATRHHLRP